MKFRVVAAGLGSVLLLSGCLETVKGAFNDLTGGTRVELPKGCNFVDLPTNNGPLTVGVCPDNFGRLLAVAPLKAGTAGTFVGSASIAGRPAKFYAAVLGGADGKMFAVAPSDAVSPNSRCSAESVKVALSGRNSANVLVNVCGTGNARNMRLSFPALNN